MVKYPIYQQLSETGSILIRTSLPPNHPLPEAIQKEFSAVTVFFASMLRVIPTVKNPKTGNPYSIHNYHIQESLLLGSGRFLKLSEDSLTIRSNSFIKRTAEIIFSEIFDYNLREKESRKISSILSGVNKEFLRMIETDHPNESKAGFTVFILEYINGVPITTVKSIFLNTIEHKKSNRFKRFLQRLLFLKKNYIIRTESYLYISNIK